MGAYLTAPNTEKVSHDESHDQLEFGVSGMQGWRMSMEDAHCTLMDIDGKNNSLFGVFDGHGGKEVADYVALNFHKFLLDCDAYQEGNIHAALKEAFLAIDEAITSDEVIKELKVLGGLTEREELEEEDEAAMLLEEANMPIEELLARIKGNVKDQLMQNGLLLPEDNDDESEKTTEENGGDKVQESKSRKQKKPVKRNVEAAQSGDIKSTQSDENSSSTVNGTSEKKCEDNGISSSKNGSSEKEDSRSEGAAGSSSNGSLPKSEGAGGSSSNGSTKSELVEQEDPDYEAGEIAASEDEEEEDEDGSDDDDDSEEESDSEDEFEDSEGVEFQHGSDEVGKDSGTTAIVALIHNNKLYVANVGDSRCIMCRNGKTVEMSFDHKPEDEIERNRIEKAGGKITMDGRVNGGLNLSRAVGDHTYKQNKDIPPEEQVISACPDIKDIQLTKEDEFMVLACDGIWNMMTNEEVTEFVKERLNTESEEKIQLSKICEELFDHCLAPNTDNDGSGCDNMTCMIVRFKHDTNNKTSSNQQKRTNDDDEDIKRDSKKAKLNQ